MPGAPRQWTGVPPACDPGAPWKRRPWGVPPAPSTAVQPAPPPHRPGGASWGTPGHCRHRTRPEPRRGRAPRSKGGASASVDPARCTPEEAGAPGNRSGPRTAVSGPLLRWLARTAGADPLRSRALPASPRRQKAAGSWWHGHARRAVQVAGANDCLLAPGGPARPAKAGPRCRTAPTAATAAPRTGRGTGTGDRQWPGRRLRHRRRLRCATLRSRGPVRSVGAALGGRPMPPHGPPHGRSGAVGAVPVVSRGPPRRGAPPRPVSGIRGPPGGGR